MKIPLTGTRVTSARLVDNILPAEYALNQNFPNPFNPSTTLRYALPVDSRVRLQIFNVLGQQVDEVVNAVQSAGRYEIFWNANAASGVYVYRLEAISRGDPGKCFVDVKKMILMR
ncbi:MAG: T9SS type A sorting domain-containing protein [Ignavibacteriales bacterium]|nr:T9SS type A sorting domain-containing protein [Ignavibacteriales bacterium]